MIRTEGICEAELRRLLDLARRVGSDPLLTQASTGNISIKRDGVLWIKASGRWMADADAEDTLIPLDLTRLLRECLRRHIDPADCHSGASTETALHAVIPRRLVLHVHCVNTIAWAVRQDGAARLRQLFHGLSWSWVPYVASGLPLAYAVERTLRAAPDTDVFVLGNHGLVVCGDDSEAIEDLLSEVICRGSIPPRTSPSPDYHALRAVLCNSNWTMPEDENIHSLGSDTVSRSILSRGILYPCQEIFSEISRENPLLPLSGAGSDKRASEGLDAGQPFRIIEGCGVLVTPAISSAALAMLGGLAQVLLRLDASAPLRYLTEVEIAAIPRGAAHRYRELASVRHSELVQKASGNRGYPVNPGS